MATKFEELLAQLESAGVVPMAEELANVAVADGPSFASQLSIKPDLLEKIKSGNSLAKITMPMVPIEKWLVQVYPDDAGHVHFQAKSQEGAFAYTRWYLKTTEEVYNAIKAAYESSSDRRKSFYAESSKQYMPCVRTGATTVDVPGYGPVEVPELF